MGGGAPYAFLDQLHEDLAQDPEEHVCNLEAEVEVHDLLEFFSIKRHNAAPHPANRQ